MKRAHLLIVAITFLIIIGFLLLIVFTGRIQTLPAKIDKESKMELTKMSLYYGECRPTVAEERKFIKMYEDDSESAITYFEDLITYCTNLEECSDSCYKQKS